MSRNCIGNDTILLLDWFPLVSRIDNPTISTVVGSKKKNIKQVNFITLILPAAKRLTSFLIFSFKINSARVFDNLKWSCNSNGLFTSF